MLYMYLQMAVHARAERKRFMTHLAAVVLLTSVSDHMIKLSTLLLPLAYATLMLELWLHAFCAIGVALP